MTYADFARAEQELAQLELRIYELAYSLAMCRTYGDAAHRAYRRLVQMQTERGRLCALLDGVGVAA